MVTFQPSFRSFVVESIQDAFLRQPALDSAIISSAAESKTKESAPATTAFQEGQKSLYVDP